ncbi:flagellar export chaperone FlgN [Serratia plymuthica]|uniref:flagella synthesis protein FlgN n=1 Tax=Serratia plymuthica TaxID=82996 RepID=UPI0004564D76|nr:flagellar export chaperone FlgN [Serratia plymuthica]AHY07995.1 flagellar biosynthesis protein FlgN [Serratia plymuthica]MBL3525103.1 flagellar export chaperone FlgN [Serratia plymuthica]MEB6538727.1 flagellar export chaperone FlgN [Serratia plymuthica]
MENLPQLLDNLLETLNALNTVLTEEHHLLCSGQLPGVALQRVTDVKSQLLATVNYLEQQRLELERAQRQQAPYAAHPRLADAWQQVQLLSQKLREKNQHNGLLLNQQIDHNAQALAILGKNNKSLYGPDGQSRSGSLLGRKIGV